MRTVSRGIPTKSTGGAASTIPLPSTLNVVQAARARVGPKSGPPCFFEPPTIVGASGATCHNQISFTDQYLAASLPATYFGATCTQNAFKIVAIGDPRNNPQPVVLTAAAFATYAFADSWSIDDQKTLKSERQGF